MYRILPKKLLVVPWPNNKGFFFQNKILYCKGSLSSVPKVHTPNLEVRASSFLEFQVHF